jgi:hypothetical protein
VDGEVVADLRGETAGALPLGHEGVVDDQVDADLLEGKPNPETFSPAMRIFLNTAVGKTVGKWFAQHGKLGEVRFSDSEDVSDGRVIRYRIELDGNPYWFSCRLARDDKISQIYWW